MKNNKLKLTKLEKIEMHSITGGEDAGGTVTCSCASCNCGTGDTTPSMCGAKYNMDNSAFTFNWNNPKKKVVDGPFVP